MIRAVALVNPTLTGKEIKSTNAPTQKLYFSFFSWNACSILNKPNFKNAITISTTPDKQHKRIAKCGPDSPPRLVCRPVISASKAVGPIVRSTHPPKKAYTIQPTNAEYKPYCGCNPANVA